MNEFAQGPVSLRAKGVAIIGSVILLSIIIFLIRKGYLKSGYSILWFFVAGSLLILSLYTDILFWFSNLIGIEYAPAAFFSVMLVGIIAITIHYSTVLSRHERRIKKLSQENAFLKNKLEEIKAKK